MTLAQGLGLLLWIGTAGLLVAGAIAAAVAWMRGGRRLAGGIGIGLAAWLAVYGTILVAVSLASDEHALAPGETRWFCGVYLDCHVGVAVRGARVVEEIGGGGGTFRARGRFWIVTVEVRNSAVRVPLGLHRPSVRIRDAAGRTWERSLDAERALAGDAARLAGDVAPGGARSVEFVFDLPADAEDPRLLVTDQVMPDRLAERVLIGDDDSVFHAPTTLRIS
jgi:hypothetical protein